MAGDWIPMRMDLLDDPAVIVMSQTLNMEEYAVVGRLLKLWSWANRHLKDGHASVPDKWVDDYLGTAGFAAALLTAGWLRPRSSGGLEFTSFDRWNSQGAKIRLGETLRKKAFRAKKATQQDGDEQPESVPKVSRTKNDPRPGPEKRREERVPNGTLAADAKPPPKEKPPRKRDELFDAVAEVTGTDPAAAGGHVAKVANALRGADPPYTPDEVREFAKRLGEFCSWAAKERRTRPELGELQKYIGRLRATRKPATVSDPFAATNGNYPPMDFPGVKK